MIACLLGNVCHITFKIMSLRRDYKNANHPFTLKQYFIDDAYPIFGDVVFSFAVVYLTDEFLFHIPWLFDSLKIMFFTVGFFGSYLILYFLSGAEKRIRKIIDDKTNTADDIKKQQ